MARSSLEKTGVAKPEVRSYDAKPLLALPHLCHPLWYLRGKDVTTKLMMTAVPGVMKSFVSDSRVPGLLPAFTKPRGPNLLTEKHCQFSDHYGS